MCKYKFISFDSMSKHTDFGLVFLNNVFIFDRDREIHH